MFDNPKEELKKLEEQLLAVESSGEDFDAFYDDILKEFGPDSAPSKQRSTSSQKNPSAKPSASKKTAATGKSKKKSRKKKKGIKGLVITLCLETAGIVGLILWWVLRIL